MPKVKARIALPDSFSRFFRKFEGVFETETVGDGVISRYWVSEVDDK